MEVFMNILRKPIFLGSLLAFTLALASCSSSNSKITSNQTVTKPEYLFVIHSNGGKIIQQSDGMHLALYNPTLTYFTDRPYRQAGHMKRQAFLNLWQQNLQNGFTKDHPNAALAGLNYQVNTQKDADQAIEINKVLVLDTVTWDQKNRMLNFKTKPLYQQNQLVEGKIDDIVLFVDDDEIFASAEGL